MNCLFFRENFKIQEESEWIAEHAPHGSPEKIYPKEQPPDYTLAVLHCPCGSSLIMREGTADDV